jgi:hypothetical protein
MAGSHRFMVIESQYKKAREQENFFIMTVSTGTVLKGLLFYVQRSLIQTLLYNLRSKGGKYSLQSVIVKLSTVSIEVQKQWRTRKMMTLSVQRTGLLKG